MPIISLVPIEIKISFNEVNGETRLDIRRSGIPYNMPFPTIVAIFSQLQLQFIKDMQQAAAAAASAPQGGPDGSAKKT